MRLRDSEDNHTFFWVALLIILWWVAVWGFIDTFLHLFIKGSPQTALLIYGTLALVVGLILYRSPQLREYFL
jgi:hypothetical protein